MTDIKPYLIEGYEGIKRIVQYVRDSGNNFAFTDLSRNEGSDKNALVICFVGTLGQIQQIKQYVESVQNAPEKPPHPSTLNINPWKSRKRTK